MTSLPILRAMLSSVPSGLKTSLEVDSIKLLQETLTKIGFERLTVEGLPADCHEILTGGIPVEVRDEILTIDVLDALYHAFGSEVLQYVDNISPHLFLHRLQENLGLVDENNLNVVEELLLTEGIKFRAVSHILKAFSQIPRDVKQELLEARVRIGDAKS